MLRHVTDLLQPVQANDKLGNKLLLLIANEYFFHEFSLVRYIQFPHIPFLSIESALPMCNNVYHNTLHLLF